MARPSGDQSEAADSEAAFVRRFVFFDSTSTTQRCVTRWILVDHLELAVTSCRGPSRFGLRSVIVKAICLPFRRPGKRPESPRLPRVSCSASPKDGRMSQICCLSDRRDVKAIRAPSGDPARATRLDFLPLVSCRFVPAATSAIQISFRRRSRPSSPRARCRRRACRRGEIAGEPARFSAINWSTRRAARSRWLGSLGRGCRGAVIAMSIAMGGAGSMSHQLPRGGCGQQMIPRAIGDNHGRRDLRPRRQGWRSN